MARVSGSILHVLTIGFLAGTLGPTLAGSAPGATAVAVPVAEPSAATPTSPTPPSLRLGREVLPTSYDVAMTIDPAAEGFEGRIRIELDLRQATSLFWLHSKNLDVTGPVFTTAAGTTVDVTLHGAGDYLGVALAREVPAGPASLHLQLRGKYDTAGSNGVFKQREASDWYVFTQFEAIAAREAFPCFDEPDFKVPWRLSLTVPTGLVAAANNPVLEERVSDDGRTTVTFAETPPLPSYLVAFAVGPFDVVDVGKVGRNKIPLRILAPRGAAAQTALAVEMTPEIFDRLEAYFGIPYPYAKLDEVTIPATVSFGAMENPGLITYSQTSLLSTPETLSISQRRRLAGVTAHEIAHQWFGNLVTMEFWDDIWLNEGFASWLGDKIIDGWKPEWGGEVSRVSSQARAIGADSLVSSRRIRQPIERPADIEDAFDWITYSKGAATLSMFENWMGEEKFRAGVNRYLDKHAFANATSSDFLAAMSAAGGAEIGPAFATFLDQPGVPLLSVAVRCDKGKVPRLALSQERFLPTGSQGSAAQTWQIPVRVRYRVGDQQGQLAHLLTRPSEEIELADAPGCPDWLLANDGAYGYYRVAYPPQALDRLLGDGGSRLSLPEKIGVLGDVRALVAAGTLEMADALAYVPLFAGADNRHLVSSVASITSGIGSDLVPSALRPNYARFVAAMFSERARELGLEPKPGEDEDTQFLRRTVVGLVGDEGADVELRGAARRLTLEWLEDDSAVSPDMIGTVLGLAVIDGDADLFGRILKAARSTEDRRRRRRLLGALGSFRDPAIASKALALALGDEFLPRETSSVVWSSFNDYTRDTAWAWLKANFDAYVDRLPVETKSSLPFVARAFCDAAHRAELEAFFRERLAKLEDAERPLQQALEAVDLCIAGKERQGPSVAAFLSKY